DSEKKPDANVVAPGNFLFWVQYGLEVKLQSKLDDARIVGTGDLAECACGETRAHIEEVSMVKRIEHLGPELQFHILFDREEFRQGEIPAPKTRTQYSAASGVTWAVHCSRNQGKCIFVEPL